MGTAVRGRRTLLVCMMIGLTALAGAGSASAATVLGQAPPTVGPAGGCSSGINNSSIAQRSISGGNSYVVPGGGGVITEWRHLANGTAGQAMRLRVFTVGAGDVLTAVAESENRTLTPSVLNSFPTRISVAGGELIGLNNGPGGQSATACVYAGVPLTASDVMAYMGDNASPPIGTPASYSSLSPYRLNIAAVLEADGDNDGFGDESQDQCPTDAATQGACPDTAAPDTTITGQPKAKTKKKAATFTFTSSEAGSTFECSLNGAPFTSCTSPLTVKGKKGKNSFAVRSKDAAGNIDPTPATFDWKVKKKKKKK